MRGMLAAVSGLKAHETMLDVVSNNIANVNTVGYKSSRTSFEDAFSQTLRGASAPVASGIGGTNATQIGLGVQLGGVESNMTEGSIQSTGVPLDAAIQGNGWFCIANSVAGAQAANPSTLLYTRSGDFKTDSAGNLVTPNGDYVVGIKVDPATGAVLSPTAYDVINIPADAKSVTIGADGTVTAVGSATPYRGKIALETFRNESGLLSQAGNMYASSANAGPGTLAAPNDPATGTGSLMAGALEMSNVDLATEFTNMIVAERGYQANSRAISTADEMLQDLMNLKH